MKDENLNILYKKLEEFIKKFYLSQIIRGLLISSALILVVFLSLIVFEYFVYSAKITRLLLFYLFNGYSALLLIFYVMKPILQYFGIISRVTYEEAAIMVGDGIEEVEDKILNIIQLEKDANLSNLHLDLLIAGINQKIEVLKPYKFKDLIELKNNLKYLKFLLPWMFIIMFLSIWTPKLISESTERYIHHNQTFEKPLPYQVKVMNNNFSVIKGDDFEIKIKVTGEYVPELFQLRFEDGRIVYMEQVDLNTFAYRLSNVSNDVYFTVFNSEFKSEQRRINVLPKPIITNYTIKVDPPNYSNIMDEEYENISKVNVLKGSNLKFEFFVQNSDSIILNKVDTDIVLSTRELNKIEWNEVWESTGKLQVSVVNDKVRSDDVLNVDIQVYNDEYPLLRVEHAFDSLNFDLRYFSGFISDDFGFSKLSCVFEDFEEKVISTEDVNIDLSNKVQNFYFSKNLGDFNLGRGEQLNCYFVLYDNDIISGPKYVRSHTIELGLPSADEIDSLLTNKNESYKNKLDDLLSKSLSLNNQIEELKEKILKDGDVSWEDQELFQNLIQEKLEVQEEVKQLKIDFYENQNLENQFSEISEKLVEKQKLLEDLLENLLDEETKILMEELQQKMDELNKDDMLEYLNKMESSNDEIESELDRNLELFKKLEFEKKLGDLKKSFEDLKKNQDKLIVEENIKSEEINEQKKLKSDLEHLENEIRELDKLNSDLENKEKLPNTESLMLDTEMQMQNALDNMETGDDNKAKQNQKKSSQNLEDINNMLQDLQNSMNEDQNAEDAELLKGILEQLLFVSFGQEELIEFTNSLNYNNPLYIDASKMQYSLQTKFGVIEDSLNALAKRQAIISSRVTKDIVNVKDYFKQSLQNIEDKRKNNVLLSQQYALTSINNLALLLSESLNNMQNNMNMSGSGSGKNQKPSKGKDGIESLEDMNKKLQQQLKEMLKKTGSQSDGKQLSESFVRMAAKQAAIRQRLQDYKNSLEKEGILDNNGLQKAIQMMEQNEKDLFNKNLDRKFLNRQKNIEHRLLEARNAEMKRGKDDKRQSENMNYQKGVSPGGELFINDKNIRVIQELLESMPELDGYYDKIYDFYINNKRVNE